MVVTATEFKANFGKYLELITKEDSYKILKLFAFQKKAKDIEDCLVAACAKSIHCDYIAARNKKDFEGFGISVLTPTEILLKII